MDGYSTVYVYENPEPIGPTYLPFTLAQEQVILHGLRTGKKIPLPKIDATQAWLTSFAVTDTERQSDFLERAARAAPVFRSEYDKQKAAEDLIQSQAWRDGINVKLDEDRMVRSGFVPENEMEVIMLFSKIDLHLGLRPMRMKINQYPDAIYEKPDGSRLFVEFEYKSSNFVSHGHDATKTDLVICWQRDRDLPVPVIELQHAYNPDEISFDLGLLNPL